MDEDQTSDFYWEPWSYDPNYDTHFSAEFDIANPEFFPASEDNPLGYDPNASYNLPYGWLDSLKYFAKSIGSSAWNNIKNAFTKSDGSVDLAKIAALGGGVLGLLNRGTPQPASYQKPIPQYEAVRQQVQQEYDPNRRPGSGGRRYFTDVQYVPKTGDTAAEALTAAQTSAGEQATGLATLNRANPYNVAPAPYVPPAPPAQTAQPAPEYNPGYSGEAVLKTVQDLLNPPKMARGGIVGLQDGGFVVPADVVSHLGNGSSDAGLRHLQKRGAVPLRGRGDGMSDSNRTMINNRQPAAVAHEEAYFPPERAQAMGGPERLYAMMDRIRKDRTGTTQQGRQINPNKYLG